jgi:hypothetical protein
LSGVHSSWIAATTEPVKRTVSWPRYRRGMDDLTASCIAREIIAHLRLSNWRFHKGPPSGGHSTPGPRREPRNGAAQLTADIKPGEIIGELVAGEVPETEAGYFYRCPDCGQAVDERDLAQVLHHEEPGHEPLPVS